MGTFPSFRSQYFPQHSVCIHLQFMFFPLGERSSFTPYKKKTATGHNIQITSLFVHLVFWMPDIMASHVRPVIIQASRKYKFPTPKFWLCCRMPSLSLFKMLNHSFEYSHLNSLLSSCNRGKIKATTFISTRQSGMWQDSSFF